MLAWCFLINNKRINNIRCGLWQGVPRLSPSVVLYSCTHSLGLLFVLWMRTRDQDDEWEHNYCQCGRVSVKEISSKNFFCSVFSCLIFSPSSPLNPQLRLESRVLRKCVPPALDWCGHSSSWGTEAGLLFTFSFGWEKKQNKTRRQRVNPRGNYLLLCQFHSKLLVQMYKDQGLLPHKTCTPDLLMSDYCIIIKCHPVSWRWGDPAVIVDSKSYNQSVTKRNLRVQSVGIDSLL